MTDKNQNPTPGAPPSEKKGNLLVFALVLFASAGLFLYIISENMEFLLVESFGTMVFLFLGLVAIIALNIQPYLIKKYYPKNNINPKNKFPYYAIGFILMSLALAIPLIFGERIHTLLVSSNLPPSLPVYMLLPLALVIRYFFREKLRLKSENQANPTQISVPKVRPSDKIYVYLPYALFFIGLTLPQFFIEELFEYVRLSVVTVYSLYFGLLGVYGTSVGPYLNNKYLPQFRNSPQKKIPFVVYNLVAFSLWLIIPLAFGETLDNFLESNNLSAFLPFFVLFPLALFLSFLVWKKAEKE